jgi:outer membrane protein assembly factor BamB
MMTVEYAKPSRASLRVPITVAGLATIAILALHHREWVETYLGAWGTIGTIFFSTIILLVWFAFFSGFNKKTRRRGLAAFFIITILAGFFLRFAVRVDGTVSGVGMPRLAWKWSPRVGDGIAKLDITSLATADLSHITPTDFPEFLGPDRRNELHDIPLATDWTKQPPRQLWRQPIGLGWGSFAVVGNYAVTQEQRGQSELTVCYDVLTGKPLWEHGHDDIRFVEWQGGDGPRSTPTIDGGRAYVMGATGLLDCLDGKTGSVIWSHDVLNETEKSNVMFGKSCSPLVTSDLVIVTGGQGGPSLLAYHKSDGSLAWTAGDRTAAYASPVLATLAGVQQIITINGQSVASFALADGKQLWLRDWPGQLPKVAQPVPLDPTRVLLTSGYGIGAVVLRIEAAGDVQHATEIWSNRYLKTKFSNVVVKDHYVYGLDDAILTCLDLDTGKRQWRGENYGFGQLLLVDDKILIQAETGEVVLMQVDPTKPVELTRFQAIEGKTWNNPALSGHRLLVRNDHEAACYELP